MYGERLRELRTDFGLTQKQLAERLGVTQKNLSKYELEKPDLSTDMIIKICNFLCAPPIICSAGRITDRALRGTFTPSKKKAPGRKAEKCGAPPETGAIYASHAI